MPERGHRSLMRRQPSIADGWKSHGIPARLCRCKCSKCAPAVASNSADILQRRNGITKAARNQAADGIGLWLTGCTTQPCQRFGRAFHLFRVLPLPCPKAYTGCKEKCRQYWAHPNRTLVVRHRGQYEGSIRIAITLSPINSRLLHSCVCLEQCCMGSSTATGGSSVVCSGLSHTSGRPARLARCAHRALSRSHAE